MATPNYDINYDDKKFTQVETDKQQALTEVEQTYGGMIDQADGYYQTQIDASKQWAEQQQQLQQENTDFTIEQIEQQKAQANKDYQKEQSGAYVDWQKQSNQYGANAEQMASNGLTNTGFSESSQVSMYNTYQNRVATARESYNQAVLNYNNAIKDAQLQNNSKQAEIAYNALQQQLELSLQGFQYKNQLLETQLAQKQATEDRYYSRYQDVLNQMNTENAMAEQVRQYNENLALQKKQMQEEIRQFNQSYALQYKQYEEGIRQFDEEIARLKAQDKVENDYKIKQLELQKDQLQHEKDSWLDDYNLKKDQLAEQKRQFDLTYNDSSGGSGGGGSDSGGIRGSDGQNVVTNSAYWNGERAENVGGFGYFNNGYQPKGVKIGNKSYQLKSSGDTTTFETTDLWGNTKTVTQTIWTANGRYFYWEGRENKYIDITDKLKKSSGGGGGRSF